MGLKLCRDGASDVLTAVHIDNGDWQGRPPAALTAMTQYYDSECAKACHNHEELVAQFAMVAEQPLQPLAALSALAATPQTTHTHTALRLHARGKKERKRRQACAVCTCKSLLMKTLKGN